MVIIDDFESGTLTGWTFSGDADWEITSNPVYEGSYAAKAGTIARNQVTRMYRSITVTERSKLSFYWKVSSEENYDFLRYYINGVQQSQISGEVEWTKIEKVLGPGEYVLEFRYDKNKNISHGSDTGYVDYITLESDTHEPGKTWIQATAAAAWSGRTGHTSLVFDNKMWVIGGYDDGGRKNDVWYSSDGITWTRATAAAGWSARYYHRSVVFDNKMWVIGGNDGGRKNDVWYSSDGITWTRATIEAGWSARTSHESVVFDNKMWVMGGHDGSRKNDVWYSTDGITWTQATAAAGWSGRYGHTSVIFDNKMWVIGGYDLSRTNDAWYTTNGITWTQATAAAAWSGRYYHKSVVFDNKMWVIGGYAGSDKNDVWFSSDGITWTQATAAAAWSERTNHMSLIFNNKMWVIGGFDGSRKNDVWYSTILEVYVNSSTGDDLNDGDSCADPVKTFGKAYDLIGPGDTIVVCNSGADFSSETVTLNKSFNLTMEGTGYFYGPKAS